MISGGFMIRKIDVTLAALSGVLLLVSQSAFALEFPLAPDRISDVSNTRHNFSVDADPLPTGENRNVQASSQKEVCVFCHTPHASNADKNNPAPLWNRSNSTATYTVYDSSSMDADMSASPQPGQPSKLCLSCHDGTLDISTVTSYFNPETRTVETTIPLKNGVTTMPATTANTGTTSNLGTDLSNDHPIGFVYDTSLATLDSELEDPAGVQYIDTRVGRKEATSAGTTVTRMSVPLEGGQVECTSCHDPHVRGTNGDEGKNIKFLRLNRFQKNTAANSVAFSVDNDIGCLACHRKEGWSASTHAHPNVADERYTNGAASQREFPTDIEVWEASCLNCHDAHTVPNAEHLLREGSDDTNTPKQAGGNPSIEDACYQCHTGLADADQVLQDVTSVADIETEFNKASHMPITTAEQLSGGQAHAITDADMTEDLASLGAGVATNRHVECTDCHHPHRMISNPSFADDGTTPDATRKGKHLHEAGQAHSNIASGSLRGSFGVEPQYTLSTFDPTDSTITYSVKKGDPGAAPITDVSSSYVTREYQVCLKCHSNYVNAPATTTSNAAMEFQAPVADQGEPGGNHRSWHPVVDATGRSSATNGAAAATYVSPFDEAVGTQTMYCSDCHTNDDSTGPKGPHGASLAPTVGGKQRILAGEWDSTTGGVAATNPTTHLCFNCHSYTEYADTTNASPSQSGFSCLAATTCNTAAITVFNADNLHIGHMANGAVCQNCHVSLPHGWKNKALLVDRPEDDALAPLYFDAAVSTLGVNTFRESGNWSKADCTTAGCH